MKNQLLVFAMFSICSMSAQGFDWAEGQEEFKVHIRHYENVERDTPEFQGFLERSWEVNEIVNSRYFKFLFEIVSSGQENLDSWRSFGNSYCLEVRRTKRGGSGGLVALAERQQILNDLLSDLHSLQPGMDDAGARYELQYPSSCEGPDRI